MPKHPPARRPLPHVCLGLGLLMTLGVADRPAQAQAAPVNTVLSVTLVQTPHYADSYEICLYSSSGFPMENTSPELDVGPQSFVVSRYVPGNSLDELVFSLTPAQFLSLHNGDALSVSYAPDPTGPPAGQYSFGTLSTPLLPAKVSK